VNSNSENKTIAVLPFVNMSASQDNAFFSDGITEEIINALAKIGSLKVTSRTSSFFFKGKNLPITEIGKKLNVSTILEGSVRLSGDSLRITAQLIQVKDDFHFWSENWDRKLENIFEIQDEISLLIADKLREHFGHFEIGEHLVQKQTQNITAYEHCLKAKFFENKWNPEDVKIAITYYEKALKLDANYSEAHLGLAGCYSFLGTTAFMPFEEAWGKTIQYTNQALALNDQLSGVHYQLSNQAFFIESDYNKSLNEMKRAIELNPNNAEAQQFISFLYIVAGDKKQSNKHLDIALSLNPLSEETHFFRAYYHYITNDYSKALELLNTCLKANDKNIPAISVKSICLLKLGKYDDVLNYFDTIPKDIVITGEKTGAIALAYALKQDATNTAIYLEKLENQAKAPNGFTAHSYLLFMYVVTQQFDKAFDWVEKAIKNKFSLLMLRYTDPIVNELKKDPRYDKYKAQIYHIDSIARTPSIGKKILIDSETSIIYKEKLLNYLTDQKPYLETNLTLRLLADKIDIHPNQLSWLLNENIGQNFNTFINKYRIEAFKLNANNPKNTHLTIEALAYESGFNSKTVFNTYFKKETGLTPKQFLKAL
jgi:adenylate cyclase